MFETLTSAQTVLAYNSAVVLLGHDGAAQVKKFTDKATGLKRLAKVHAQLVAMYGVATLKDDQTWDVETKTSTSRVNTTLDLDQVVEVLVANPKRKNSRAFLTFELYQAGYTGANFVAAMEAAGFTRKLALSTLHWDLDHGFVALVSA